MYINIKVIISFLIFFSSLAHAQYEFKDEIRIYCTPMKDQQETGTCWSFSTISFLESEMIRLGKEETDLSEMYNVRMIYLEKAKNYVLRQGTSNFSQGGLAHDLLRSVKLYGMIPQEAYPGLNKDERIMDDNELAEGLKAYLDAVIETENPGKNWIKAVNGILDAYLDTVPTSFIYNGKRYDPYTFYKSCGINPDDYVNITSFNHHPFNEHFILEIPDNFSNGIYFNIKLNEMMDVVNSALEKGYTLAWDGDVSEKGFSQKSGIAILPVDEKRDSLFTKPGKEMDVTQHNRQENFMNYKTADDHLMQVVGRAKDKNGNVYYIIKNSWGEVGPYKGFLYMSEAYFRMKTISITLHKDAVPAGIRRKM